MLVVSRALGSVCLSALFLVAGAAQAQNVAVYDDALAAGWSDYSYGTGIVVNFANGAPVHAGAASVAVTFNAAFSALSLRTATPLDGTQYSDIRFWIYGGPGGTTLDAFTQPSDGGAGSTAYQFVAPAAVWTQVTVPLLALGSPGLIARINLQDSTGASQPTFYVDQVEVLAGGVTGPGLGARETISDRVLGQAAFNTGGSGTTATTLNGPAAVAVGPDGRLFIADYENSRVLSWDSARDFVKGASATLVLGQTNFTNSGTGNGLNRLDHPEGVTVDPNGNVFVADTNNHRIMAFSPPLSNGMNRTAAWGSFDPAPNCSGVGLSVFCFPRAMASDGQGNIYLVDEFHNRILIYQAPLSTDTTPDKVIGGLSAPRGVAVDALGNVYASDSESDMVREYDTPLVGDTTVDRNYGSGSDGVDCFSSAVPAPTQTSLACPIDLAVDRAGNLYVSDLYHNRVLAYLDPLNDSTPDVVFGQHGSFTTGTADNGGRSAESLHTPLGLAADVNGSLYVADFDNNRVLAFDGVKGDFNEDSQVDLVFRHLASNRNMVWSMSGDVSTGSSWVTPDPQGANWQVMGSDDFNRDNQADLLFWNASTGAVEFWLMSNSNRLGDAVPIGGAPTLATNWKPSATGDFNADGRPDILWRNTTSQKLVIWTLDGTNRVGTILPVPDQAVNFNWEVVAALDYDKDGNRDLLWYNFSSGKIVLWTMDANMVRLTGNFTTPANAGDNNWKVYAGGDLGLGPSAGVFATNDIVWRNATSGKVVVWYMNAAGVRTSGTFTTPDSPLFDPDGTPTAATAWVLVGPR